LQTGTGTDQNTAAGFTGALNPINTTQALTTTWTRYTHTATLSATATEIGVQFYFTPVGTAGAADYFEVTGVQLELGSYATTFSRAGGTYQGELAACMRYAQMYNSSTANGTYYRYAYGGCDTTTTVDTLMTLPVPMRTTPSVTTTGSAGNYGVFHAATVTQCTAGPSITTNGSNQSSIGLVATVASGLTAGRAVCILSQANNISYILLTAEL